MDVESKEQAAKKARNHRKRNICIGVAVAIIAIILLIVILALTVFKARSPVIDVRSVALDDLSVSIDIAKVRVNLNVSLDVSVAIKNPNKVSVNYQNSSAQINYRGNLVGEVPIPAGRMPADKTATINTTVTLLADRLLSNSKLFSDVVAGSLPFNTYAKIVGKVRVLGIKIKVTATSTCDFTVFVGNRTVSDQNCKYKTKL